MLGNQFCFTFLLTCPRQDGSRAQSNGGPVITYEDAYQGNGTRDLRQTFDLGRSTDDVTNVNCLCLFLASLLITTEQTIIMNCFVDSSLSFHFFFERTNERLPNLVVL